MDVDDVWHVAAVVREVEEALRQARRTLSQATPDGWAATHDLPSRVGAVLDELDGTTSAGAAAAAALATRYVAAAEGYQDADQLRAPH